MSRLTERINGEIYKKGNCESPCSKCDKEFYCDELEDMMNKLAHYEDLEEQGLLLELPCKVGDTVWAIFPTWTPMECEVVAIEILTSTVNIETKVVDSDADRIFWPADFGNTVFLTKEETELKLAELKGTEE